MRLSFPRRDQYTLLNPASSLHGASVRFPRVWLALFVISTSLVSFYIGRISTRQSISTQAETLLNLDRYTKTFKYQRIFGERPSNDSDYAWIHLFPAYGGFFGHPDIAPQRSTFSVFHQLHCLDGIRQGYWTLYDIIQENGTVVFDEEQLPMMASPSHIRHCIDLLRQSLMCNPDLTIEIKDNNIGGVKGFGTPHQCFDYDQLVSWTKAWQRYGMTDDQRTG